MPKYMNGERVIVHSLGDDKEYLAEIQGVFIESDSIRKEPGLYIVKPETSWRSDYDYSCLVVTGACIRPVTPPDEFANVVAIGMKQ